MDTHLGELVHAAAAEVHAELGGGLSECVYQAALAVALRQRGCVVETEMVVPIVFKSTYVGFVRPDLVVNKQLVLEIKAVSKIAESHLVQLRAYLRWLSPPPPSHAKVQGKELGALINFGADGVEVRAMMRSVPELMSE